ncbi:MAG: DUF547 domain-containing protein [Deltaproteobacteria bacterium]|nr:DUF547 domain-containing protein [Deltaproteobacteria bacterium]
MKTKKLIIRVVLWVCFFCGATDFLAPEWSNAKVDHALYAELLEKYVQNGTVDYQGFKNEEAKLDQYLKVLEETDTKTLSRDEQFAFYINAYNAWTIKLILTGYPGIKSIKDLGSIFKSPWKKQIARINGDIITLDHIEHDILRPGFKDPRVHFAVNCAAKSCPPLRSEPYRADILEEQLDEMTKAFINDSRRNRIEWRTLYVSSIFKWFSEDFNNDVVDFFLKYAQGDLKKKLEKSKSNIQVKYLGYDWSLNGK